MTTRWWVSPPRPDESLRSLVDRAAALYECSSGMLWDSLHQGDSRSCGDVDDPSCPALLRLANAVGLPAARLHVHRLPDAPWVMAPGARRSYCPECWNLDLAQERPYAIRRDWCRVLKTRCSTHGLPLSFAREAWASGKGRFKFPALRLSPEEQGILDLIEAFGIALEQSLFFGVPWPKGWRWTPHAARSLLISVSFNVNSVRDLPAIRNVAPEGNLSGLIYGPRQFQEPASKLAWDSFRSLANPAHRRAALWAVAWTFIPNLSLAYSPGWFQPLPA